MAVPPGQRPGPALEALPQEQPAVYPARAGPGDPPPEVFARLAPFPARGSELPGRQDLGRGGKLYGAVLGPGTADHGQLDVGALGERCRVGQVFKLDHARLNLRPGAVVVHHNLVAVALKLLRQKQARGLLGDVSIRLVGQPEHGDGVRLAHQPANALEQIRVGAVIHLVRSLGQRRVQVQLPGGVGQQPVVAREAGPAIAQARAQVFAAHAAVAADGIEDLMDVRLGKLLGNHAQLVGEADLHRHVAVEGDFGQLGADDGHAGDVGLVLVVLPVQGLEHRAALGIGFADQHQVRLEQAFHDVAQGYKLGVVAHTEIPAAHAASLALEHRDENRVHRAGSGGRAANKQMAGLALRAHGGGDGLHCAQQELVGETAIRQARGGGDEESHVGGDRLAVVLGGAEPGPAGGDGLRQEGFLDRGLARIDPGHLFRVNVNAHNLEPALGQGRRDASAKFA